MAFETYQTPNQKYFPPVFQAAGTMTPRALTWRSLLYDLLFAVWEIGLPEGWLLSPFRYMLFGSGSLGVLYTREYGWIYGFYGVERIGWQWEPLVFNVVLNNQQKAGPFTGVRGINGAVLHIRDDWSGYGIMIDQYADLLASCDKGVSVNLDQARTGKLISTANKKDADTLETAFHKAREGEAVAYVNSKLFTPEGKLNMAALLDVGSEYVADKILTTRMMILKDFLTRVGVRTVGMEKREHLLNQEIMENNDETGAEPLVVSSSLEPDLKLLREMGLNGLTIRPRFDYSGAGQTVAPGEEEEDGKEQNFE